MNHQRMVMNHYKYCKFISAEDDENDRQKLA